VRRSFRNATGENIATCDALTGGNFKDAPHPNCAKLYLTWLLAKEQQSRLGSFSSRGDVPPARRLPTVRVLNYREFMTNDKLVARPAHALEGYTGPPANKGGVR
jgi:hypothetical protein